MSATNRARNVNTPIKMVGHQAARKALHNEENIAVLSSFLPNDWVRDENLNFYCARGKDCYLGDPHLAEPGKKFIPSHLQLRTIIRKSVIYNRIRRLFNNI